MYLERQLTWQERQAQIENRLQVLEQNQNDFNNPLVVQNPYEIAPLTAVVLFEIPVAQSVQVTVFAQDGIGDLQYRVPVSTKHRVPIYGLYADAINKVQLTLDDGTNCMVSIITEPLPKQLALGNADGVLPNDHWMFTVPLADCSLPAAYDKNGICRWYCTESLAYQITQTTDGHILTCGPALLSPPYSATAIWKMDLLGKIHREYRIPGGVCNGFTELPNGNLLALHQFFPRGTAADMCVEIDRITGMVVKQWDFRELLPMLKGGSTSQNGSDWIHAASVWYDELSDSITVAAKYKDSIINIGYSSGQLNWILGDAAGWPEDFAEQYFLKPQDELFTWCYEPECVQMLPNHRLLCLDNGHLRTKKGGEPLPLSQRYSRVVCYQLYPEQKTVQELWSYGKGAGNQLYSPYMGNCAMYSDGQFLMNFGGIGFLHEQPTEPPAYFVQKDYPDVEMKTVILVKNETAAKESYRLVLPINCYHATLLSIQDCIVKYSEDAGIVLGSWHGNDVYELDMEWEDAGLIPEQYQIQTKLTSEQLIVSGDFRQGEMIMLLLEGDNAEGKTRVSYYMQTTRSPYLTASKQTYAKGDIRPIKYVVDLKDLAGTYEICIGIDDKKYHTNLWFVCESEVVTKE